MQLLLTGATGFVGGRLLQALLAQGHTVRALVRDPARLVQADPPSEFLQLHRGSLSDPASLRGACEGVDVVIHVAGLVAARRRAEFMRVNQEGTAALVKVALDEAPGAHWIQVSSLAATGPGGAVGDSDEPRPVSDYGRSKLAGERELVRLVLPRWTVLRPCAVYGPGDVAFLPFFKMVQQGLPIVFPAGKPLPRYSFVHVDDLVASVLAASKLAPENGGRVFHIAHPEIATLPEFLAALGVALGRQPRLFRIPVGLAWFLAALVTPWRRLTGSPKFFSLDKMKELQQPAWCCRPSGAQRELPWQPRFDLAEGLADTVAHYRRHGQLKSDDHRQNAGAGPDAA